MPAFHNAAELRTAMIFVTYATLEDFHAGVIAFVRAGLTFRADAEPLTIALTGGF